MHSKIIVLVTIFSVFNGAIAEYSYMDSIQRKRLHYNAASWLAFRSTMMIFPTSNQRGRFTYSKFGSMQELENKELQHDQSFKLEFQNRFNSKDRLQAIVDSSSLVIPFLSKLADFKKDSELVNTVQNKFDRVLY